MSALTIIQAVGALAQTVMGIVATGFFLHTWHSGIRRERKWQPAIIAKDTALMKAHAFIKTARKQMVYSGPSDDDPVRALVDEIEHAIQL